MDWLWVFILLRIGGGLYSKHYFSSSFSICRHMGCYPLLIGLFRSQDEMFRYRKKWYRCWKRDRKRLYKRFKDILAQASRQGPKMGLLRLHSWLAEKIWEHTIFSSLKVLYATALHKACQRVTWSIACTNRKVNSCYELSIRGKLVSLAWNLQVISPKL